jgi:ankyrin repeat protein
MATRDDQRALIKLARKGKLEGDDGFRQKLTELLKSGFTSDDLDFNEKPYHRSAIWEASWKNFEGIVKLLVEKKANVQFPDYQGRTPLHEAAYYGHENLVAFLVENGHDVDIVDEFGQTPLFRACEGSRIGVVGYLLKKGANTSIVDCDGVSVRHLLGFQGQGDNAEYLLYKGAWKNQYSVDEPGPAKPQPPITSLFPLRAEAGEEAAAPAAEPNTKDTGV